MSVEYKVLRSNIIRSCKGRGSSIDFDVDMQKLYDLAYDLGLTLINVGESSNKIKEEDVLYIAEYFKEKRLSWVNGSKRYTTLLFVNNDAIDERLEELMKVMNSNTVSDPNLDKVEVLAEICANYPCYTAMVISYTSNDPRYNGRLSYEIICRANTVTIKQENYKYNHKDMV